MEQHDSLSPGGPAITLIVGQLIEPAVLLPRTSTCLEVQTAFQHVPDATSLVLKLSDGFLLVDRREFDAYVARGTEEHGEDFLKTLTTEVIPGADTLIVPSWAQVDDVYIRMAERPPHSRYKDLIVHDEAHDTVGLLSAATLLDEVARANAREALHDPLTGLANRQLLLEWLEHGLTRRHATGEFALMFIDLDRFKVINDSIGHAAGDELLIGFAERLMSVVRPTDAATRLGGDEFALLVDGISVLSDAGHVARRLLDALREPLIVEGREVVQTASIGIVMPDANDTVSSLLRKADVAMYDAKRAGGNRYHYFEGALAEAADRRLEVEIWLRKAIDRASFELVYHPIVELDSLQLHGFEALVRGVHPQRGILTPADFLTVAEETGMIVEIDRITMDCATQQLARWASMDELALTMNVNLSAQCLNRNDGLAQIAEVIERSSVDPTALQVEVTETGVIHNIQRAAASLQTLRARGIRVAIDDFGTGYSSMAQLSRLPFDTLKVDRTFVSQMSSSGYDATIVRLMVAFARALELDAVAEGVETPGELQQLREMGCRLGQGYLFAQPLSAADATELIHAAARNGGAIPLPAALQNRRPAA